MGRQPSTKSVADQLAARAMSYAQEQIEEVELRELPGVVSDALVAGTEESGALDVVKAALAAMDTENMEIITNAIARAFVHGYAAKLDDAKPVEALGGLAEQQRRRKGRAGGR